MPYTLLDTISSTAEIVKDGSYDVLALSNSRPGGRFLCFIEDPRFLEEALKNEDLSCVLCSELLVDCVLGVRPDIGVAVSDRPRWAYFELHNRLAVSWLTQNATPSVIDETATVSEHAVIAENGVIVGPNVVIEPFAVVNGPCSIGAGSIIRSGACVGSQGFEYKRSDSEVLAVQHVGAVLIGRNVELKSNASVDLAVYPWDRTVLGDFTKINSGGHVDHGAKLGKRVFVGANAVISGRVAIGDDVTIGPGSIVSNRLSVGDGAVVSIGSVVTKDVPRASRVTGNFAIPHNRFIDHIKNIASQE